MLISDMGGKEMERGGRGWFCGWWDGVKGGGEEMRMVGDGFVGNGDGEEDGDRDEDEGAGVA